MFEKSYCLSILLHSRILCKSILNNYYVIEGGLFKVYKFYLRL